jgi:hypothetical protein
MAQRADLHAVLLGITGNVYFQPPSNLQMSYPCIRYERTDIKTEFADNSPYKHMTAYTVTIIDQNPDSDIPAKVGALPMCVFDRFYTADNLNHDVYKLFF